MKKFRILVSVLIIAMIGVKAGAQSTGGDMPMMHDDAAKKVNKAVCVVYPTQGNKVTGTITFTRTEGGVKVVADVQGLTQGKHGIHIHEFGDCTSADGNSAGGHFNPAVKNHGAPMDANRHDGDMGNITADASGKGHLEYVDKTMSLDGDNSILGKAMIIHASEDDFKTQPTGNAGARVACGVIGVAK